MIMETVCPDCGGRGRKVKDACPECKGAGTVPYAKELKIKVPAGIDDGTRIRLAGEGMPGVGGGTNGDLYIFVTVREHKLYSRQGAGFVRADSGVDGLCRARRFGRNSGH